MCLEESLYPGQATLGFPTPARGHVATNAAASYAGDDAVATIHRRASVCGAQVPHFRTRTILAARTRRGAGRDQSGNHGVQPKTHAQCARRDWAERRAGIITPHQFYDPSAKTKKRCSEFQTSLS